MAIFDGVALHEMAILAPLAYRDGNESLAENLVGTGWTAISPGSLGFPGSSSVGGYFVHGDAAAYAARNGDALALVFRGSDSADDLFDSVVDQAGHFAKLEPFIERVLAYAADDLNGVEKLYVTGHSLGGSMAHHFASEYGSGDQLAAFEVAIATFGAAGDPDLDGNPVSRKVLHVFHTDDVLANGNLLPPFSTDHDFYTGFRLPISLPKIDGVGTAEHDEVLYGQTVGAITESPAFEHATENTNFVVLSNGAPDSGNARSYDYDGDSNTFILGMNGADTIHGGGDTDLIDGALGADLLKGHGGRDRLYGSAGNDKLDGGGGRDVLEGGAGNDQLLGNDGQDVLNGAAGADTLTGGIGADRFDFDAVSDSPSSAFDVITDFRPTQLDRIDLSDIDANGLVAGNQAFSFVGADSFTAAGQLRYAAGTLACEVTGDGVADLVVQLLNSPLLEADDFVL